MDKVVNVLSFSGWLFLVVHVGAQLFMDPVTFRTTDISLDVLVLRIVQTFQLMDIILILIGKSHGNIVAAFFQILGRMSVLWIYIEEETDPLKFGIVVLMWSIADANRYLYYLFKHPILTMLRYNSFIILYPLGIYGQMNVMNDYLKRNAETISHQFIVFTRCGQACIIIGFICLYNMMLQSRKKQAKINYGFQSTESQNQRPRSPRPKRQ